MFFFQVSQVALVLTVKIKRYQKHDSIEEIAPRGAYSSPLKIKYYLAKERIRYRIFDRHVLRIFHREPISLTLFDAL